jgi:hypothetical protein
MCGQRKERPKRKTEGTRAVPPYKGTLDNIQSPSTFILKIKEQTNQAQRLLYIVRKYWDDGQDYPP